MPIRRPGHTIPSKKGQAFLPVPRNLHAVLLSVGCGFGWSCFRLFARGTFDASGFASEVAQVVQPCAAHTALANYVNRGDGRRVQREYAFHAGAETDAPHREGRAAGTAFLRNHHSFKSLDAFLDLFPFALEKADIHAHGVAGTKFGEVFAQLRFVQLTNYRIHLLYSLETHSGGASTFKANTDYSQKIAFFLAVFAQQFRPVSHCLL